MDIDEEGSVVGENDEELAGLTLELKGFALPSALIFLS